MTDAPDATRERKLDRATRWMVGLTIVTALLVIGFSAIAIRQQAQASHIAGLATQGHQRSCDIIALRRNVRAVTPRERAQDAYDRTHHVKC